MDQLPNEAPGESDDESVEDETPAPEVIQRVAEALEATGGRQKAPEVTLVSDKAAEPLPPRRRG